MSNNYRPDSGEPPHRTQHAQLVSILAIHLLISLSGTLTTLPISRAIERRLCESHYHNPTPESACKIPPIQHALARTQGLLDTAILASDLLSAIPISAVVIPRWGIRTTLRLNLIPRAALFFWIALVGCVDALALRAGDVIWPAVLGVLGGDCVFRPVVYGLVARASADAGERAAWFGYVAAVQYGTTFAGPALAALLMGEGRLWVPFVVGLGLVAMAVPFIGVIQERSADRMRQAAAGERTSLLAERGPPSPAPSLEVSHKPNRNGITSQIRAMAAFVGGQSSNLALLLVTFLLTALASSDSKMLPQYMSKRFSWTFAQTGYVLSIKAVINTVYLTTVARVLVPRILGSSRGGDGEGPDSRARGQALRTRSAAAVCLWISVLGAVLIAFSSNAWALAVSLTVYALGAALPIFTHSLLVTVTSAPASDPTIDAPSSPDSPDSRAPGAGVAQTQVVELFTIATLAKAVGSLLGAPLMAAIWVWGIDRGGSAVGAPFFVSAVIYLLSVPVLGLVRV